MTALRHDRSFHNHAFCEIHQSGGDKARDGTALGAALLWRRFSRTHPVSSVVLEAVTPLGEDEFESRALSAAYQSWIAFSESPS